MSNKISFESEHRAFAYIFAGAVTLATFPVVGWHYATTLSGLALAAIAGLAINDIVLWFAAHWSVKVKSGALRTVALCVKFVLALVMVINAGIVIYLMRGDHQTDALIRQQTDSRKVEIAARADAAVRLASVEGGRSAAREMVKMSSGPDAQAIASNTRAQLESIIPAWYLDVGIYTTPPISAIFGFMALTVCASIIKRREEEAEAEETISAPRPVSAQASPSIAPVSQKPVQAWRGGVVVRPGANVRPQ